MQAKYIAIIGDIIDSRHLGERGAVQQELEGALVGINFEYSSTIKAEFLITLGDEFQGLMVPSSAIFTVVSQVLEQMHPVKIRFGLGYGRVTTPMKETAIGMDGPAFYAARQALDTLKGSKEPGARLEGASLDPSLLKAVNALLDSIFVIRQFWSDKFKAALPFLRRGLTQVEVAEILEISQATVSWMLYRARWRQVKAIENSLQSLLDALF